MEYDPNHITETVLYSIFSGESLVKLLINSDLQSIGAKMNAARGYAEDHYTLGLPNQYFGSSNKVSDSTLAGIITTDLSLPYGCIIDFNSIAPLTSIAAILPYLLYEKGYDIFNGQITTPPAALVNAIDVYLGTAQALAQTSGSVSRTYYVSEVALALNNTSVNITYQAILTYTSTDVNHEVTHTVMTVDPSISTYIENRVLATGLQIGSMYYIAGYRELDEFAVADDTTKWWYYNIESGKYAALNPNAGGESNSNSYPVVPVRYNNVFISPTNEPDIYDTGTELLKRIGVEFDQLVDSLSTNPDIAGIDHAYVTFGVDLQTTNLTAIEYLVDFFTFLSEEDDNSIFDTLAGVSTYDDENYFVTGVYANESGSTTDTTGGDTVINPADTLSLTEHGLNIQITYKSITSTLVDGSIGDIGFVTKTIVNESDPEAIVYVPGTLILRKQLAANVYREIVIVDLTHINAIYDNRSITTRPIDVAADPDEHSLVIPLHYTVARRFGISKRNELYQESMLLVINSIEKSHARWYQTDLFKLVYMIIAVVIAVTTLQPWVAGLMGALEVGIQALMLYLLQSVVAAAVVHYASAAIAKEFGPDIAVITSLILMAVGAAAKSTALNIFNLTLPTAQAFLFLGSVFMEASSIATNNLLREVEDEYNDFLLDAEAEQALLDAAEEELDIEYNLPISYLEPPNYPTPDILTNAENFYDKIHVGNIGTLSLNVIENYVDTALLLPDGV